MGETLVSGAQLGVGESEAEQTQPACTVAREKMQAIIKAQTSIINDAKALLEMLNANPHLDESMTRLFQMKSQQPIR